MALEDLKLDDTSSADLGGYFLVTITDLDLGTAYPLQFQYVYADKRENNNWSAPKSFTTEFATVPSEPELLITDVVGGAGFIKVTWSGNNASGSAIANFDRVDVHISGTTFGDGTKPAGSFKSAGTQTFTCTPGIYIVQLKVYSLNGQSSFYSSARTVTVTAATPAAESSVTPSTPTVSSVLGAIQLSWNGKTSSGADQPFGFNAAKVYVGTSSSFTPSDSNQVDVLNFANGQNTLNIGVGTIVNGTALTYGTDYYVKIATTNGTDLSTPVLASGSPVQIGKVSSGDIVTVLADQIATGTLSSSSTITVGSTSGKHVKLSGTGDPFIIYGSGGTSNPVLSYNGTKLTIVGDGTFSGNLSAAGGSFTGTLSAASGSFSGTITASGGSIGGITIAADGLQNSGNTFKLDSAGKARFGSSSGNAVVIDPTTGVYHSADGGSTTSGKFTLSPGGTSKISGWTIGTTTLTAGNVTLNSNGSMQVGSNFSVATDGVLTASGANINGSLTTTNLSITAAGAITTTSEKFGVTSGGVLTAIDVDLTGKITASSGQVGGWYISTGGVLQNAISPSTPTTYFYSTDNLGYSIITTNAISSKTFYTNGYGIQGGSVNLVVQGNLVPGLVYATTTPSAFSGLYNLGSSSYRWGTVYAENALNTSDERLKTDIQETTLGLEFINKLNPVSYKRLYSTPITSKDEDGNLILEGREPGERLHHGFIAQEVKSALNQISDTPDMIFAGWALEDIDDQNSTQLLGYHQFIAPIVKAIQEISNKLNNIEQRLDALEA